ncbi:MAE_28990/MAE_18760 family HEPN-like nuclease [Alcaligenes faecalis]|uniref:MAE_28990/MAE_18760 family HEPN-like nuclease n=1 Tax=Alcaligenes faecalis TaxID=511 RepID=UPI001EEFD279|nr:MAE_28990/MAE_18760 family HEPN-like nuclease [Alcaligenes faecalis]ULH05362.1 MAE_28990/MAE_18760 family HEPN-like nuclease [Alcaligenes faecalis]
MDYVKDIFNKRINDIETYFELVSNIEEALGEGEAKILAKDSYYKIKVDQQKMIYAGVYMHLYNLIESTVTTLLQAVERHAQDGISGELKSLTDNMRVLYVKSVIDAGSVEGEDKRLEKALSLFRQTLSLEPFKIKIPPGGGGNWEIKRIEEVSKKIGVRLTSIPRGVRGKVNRPYRNGDKPFYYIKVIRNKLAHGELSFVECGDSHVASDLRELIDTVKEYLTHLINAYDIFILNHQYKLAGA